LANCHSTYRRSAFSRGAGIDLSVEVIGLDVGGDLCLPLVAVVQQLLLVVEQLLVGLR
jgi:hypothetical protein